MALAFSFYEIDHDDMRSCKLALIALNSNPPAVAVREAGFFDCANFGYEVLGGELGNSRVRVFGINRKEYASKSGIRVVEPYNIKPVISTNEYDFYVAEWIGGFGLVETRKTRIGRRVFKERVVPTASDAAFRKAVERYKQLCEASFIIETSQRAVELYELWAEGVRKEFKEPNGAFLWRVRQGYPYALLVRSVDASIINKFTEIAAEYAILHILKAI